MSKDINLKIGHLNIWSLYPKLLEIRAITQDCDILAITESWLSDSDCHLVSIDGYKYIERGRGTRGGGVGFYIRNSINFEILKIRPYKHESLAFVTSINQMKCIFCVFYRTEKLKYAKFIEGFEDLYHSLLPNIQKMFFLGNDNIDLLAPETPKAKSLLSLLRDLGLEQLITEPTRITEDTKTLHGAAEAN